MMLFKKINQFLVFIFKKSKRFFIILNALLSFKELVIKLSYFGLQLKEFYYAVLKIAAFERGNRKKAKEMLTFIMAEMLRRGM